MTESRNENKSGNRREFRVRRATLPAALPWSGGSHARLMADRRRLPRSRRSRSRGSIPASSPHAIAAGRLGPLADLPGTWVGNGFNLISLPDFHEGKTFRLQLNVMVETLAFTPVGGKVPESRLRTR